MNLVNAKTNALEELPQDQASAALKAGTHNLEAGKPVNVINPDGKLVSIPAEQLPDAINKYQYKLPDQSHITEHENQEKYGEGVANQLKAAALGAGETATFGLSNQILTKSGLVKPETIKEIEKRNPGSHLTGEAAGILGSVLAPESLVGAVAKAGTSVSEAVAASRAAKVLDTAGELGAKALGSAVEGAFYGAGQTINEEALGDPGLNGEKIMSNLGYGILLGGAAGTLFKGAELAAPKVASAAKDALKGLYETGIGGSEDGPGLLANAYSKVSSVVTGVPQEDILTAIKNRASSGIAKDEMQKSLTENLNGLKKNISETAKKTISEIRPEETEKLLKKMPFETALPEAQKVADSVDSVIAKMVDPVNEGLYPKRFVTKLEQLRDGFLSTIGESEANSGADVFKAINDLKKNLDTKIPWKQEALSGESADAISALKGLRGELKQSLENQEVWGHAASRQSAFNEKYAEYLNAEKLFQKQFVYKSTGQVDPSKVKTFLSQISDARGEIKNQILKDYVEKSKALLDEVDETYKSTPKTFDRSASDSLMHKNAEFRQRAMDGANIERALKGVQGASEGHGLLDVVEYGSLLHHPLLALPIEAWKAVANPSSTIARLAAAEKLINKTTNAIASGVKAIFSGGKAAQAEKSFLTESVVEKKGFQKFVSSIKEVLGNPQTLLDKVGEMTAPLQEPAPMMAGSSAMVMTRALQFLRGQLPNMPQEALAAEYEPSETEKAQFARSVKIIEDPLHVLKEVKNGTLTPESIAAVSTVYPKLYQEMKNEVLDHVSGLSKEKKENMPFQIKQSLSMFLGQPLDSALTPQRILSMQSSYMQAPSPQPGGAPAPKGRSLSKLDVASKYSMKPKDSE